MKIFGALVVMLLVSAGAIAGVTNTNFDGETVQVTWTAQADAQSYYLFVGSTDGGREYVSSGVIDSALTTYEVAGLPADGSDVFVTFWVRTAASGWQSESYQFDNNEYVEGGGGEGSVLDRATIDNISDTNEMINQIFVLVLGAGLVGSFAKGFQSGLAR